MKRRRRKAEKRRKGESISTSNPKVRYWFRKVSQELASQSVGNKRPPVQGDWGQTEETWTDQQGPGEEARNKAMDQERSQEFK